MNLEDEYQAHATHRREKLVETSKEEFTSRDCLGIALLLAVLLLSLSI